jgi:hypothetical protein
MSMRFHQGDLRVSRSRCSTTARCSAITYVDDIVEGVLRCLTDSADAAADALMHTRGLDERSAVPDLQHRQQPAGRTPRVHPPAGGGNWAEGSARSPADAAG